MANKTGKIEASFQDKNGLHGKVRLSLFMFEENNIFFIYSPALDLTGYGNTTKEAEESFATTLQAFMKYTTSKKTLDAELKRLGWKLTGKKHNKQFKLPDMNTLLRDNEHFMDILENKEYRKFDKEVELV